MDKLNLRDLTKNNNPAAVELYKNYLSTEHGKNTIKNLLNQYPDWTNAGSTDRNNFIDAVITDIATQHKTDGKEWQGIKTSIEDMILDRIIL